jgi:TonB-linked SusC/RagA family outer membrane protein
MVSILCLCFLGILCTGVIRAQQKKIAVSGIVRDNVGVLPGVNVYEKGTNNATITNENGYYRIEVSDNKALLVFSFIGYTTQEIATGYGTEINPILVENVQKIEEVVVIGYGTQKKESIIGSIVQTNNEELLKSGNVIDLKQALTGRLPGVITSTSTGEPGGYGDGTSATSIFIRGRNSWNNSQPLILVDGVERNMDNIDVTEVETISVLKDASATAVFGVKGANGVILITTKRGKAEKPQLSISYDVTTLMVSKLPDKLDSYDALRLRNESIERNVVYNESLWGDYTPAEILRRYRQRDYPEYEYIYPNVDWTKALFKEAAWSQKLALNIQGGTDFVKYFGALTYLYEGDMFREYDNHKGYEPSYAFNRFNFRSNFDFNLTRSTLLKVNLSGYFSQKNTNYSWTSTEQYGINPNIWSAAYGMSPDRFVPQYPDGTWGAGLAPDPQNPVAYAYNLGVWERKTVEMDASLNLEQKLDFITKGLSFSGFFSYDNNIRTVGGLYDQANQVFVLSTNNTPATVVYPERYKGPDQNPSEYMQRLPEGASSDFDWTVKPWVRWTENVATNYEGTLPIIRRMVYQAQLLYNRKFNLHNVGAMGVFKRDQYASGNVFPFYREDWAFRVTYDYDSRYFIETNGAYNGSEKFSPDYRFDFFPSFAAGWYVSNEKFFQLNWFNKLKLRYSIGWVGDDSGGARWAYQSQYNYGGSVRLDSDLNYTSPYSIYAESVVANPDLHWEKAKKSNYGLETGFLNNLITINFDYYTENRTDIIIAGSERAIPPFFGATPPAANLGKVDSKGFELELSLNKKTSYGLEYWGTLAITHTRNKIVFKDDPELQPDYMKQAGYSIGQTRTLTSANMLQNWDDVYASVPQEVNDAYKVPGFYNIIDFDGDGLITNYDKAPYGYPDVPENTYNLTLGAALKGFSLMLQFYGVNNITCYMPLANFPQGENTLYAHTLDYWSKDNSNASSFLPRYLTEGNFIGNYYYYDGSFIRLKTAELAYNLRKSLLDKLGVSGLKLYVNGNNLWLWSRLPDDRENRWNGGDADRGAYPTLKRINFGINITF